MPVLSKLEESLLAMSGLKYQLEPALRTFKRYIHDMEAKEALSNYLLILVVSFSDEWRRFERLNGDEKIQRTLDTAKPAVNRILAWKGIPRLRSSMLAHGFRGGDGCLVNPATLVGEGKSPSTFAERVLLAECAVYAIATVLHHHMDSKNGALESLLEIWPDEEPESCGIQTMSQFEQEVLFIRRAIVASDPALDAAFSGSPAGR